MVRVRAILGETIVDGEGSSAVALATRDMLLATLAEHGVTREAVVSAVFALTPEIASAFPAATARAMGWTDVPLLCVAAVPVAGSSARKVQVLLHVVIGA